MIVPSDFTSEQLPPPDDRCGQCRQNTLLTSYRRCWSCRKKVCGHKAQRSGRDTQLVCADCSELQSAALRLNAPDDLMERFRRAQENLQKVIEENRRIGQEWKEGWE